MHHRLAYESAEKEATTCWEAPIFDSYPDSYYDSTRSLDEDLSLTITSTPQGRFVYWKGFEPPELLDDPSLIAYIPGLPFQYGRPLSPIEEVAETVLVDYSTTKKETHPVSPPKPRTKSPTMSFRQMLRQTQEEKEIVIALLAGQTPPYVHRTAGARP